VELHENALTAIDEAVAGGGDRGKIEQARRARRDGDSGRSLGAFKNAIKRYKDALASAEGA
jgi:hypothetical protein